MAEDNKGEHSRTSSSGSNAGKSTQTWEVAARVSMNTRTSTPKDPPAAASGGGVGAADLLRTSSSTGSAGGPHVRKKSGEKVSDKYNTGSNFHSYSQNEIAAFTTVINQALANCGPVAHLLPIDVEDEGEDFGKKVGDGLLISSLVYSVDPDVIRYRDLNFVKKKSNGQWSKLNDLEVLENHNIFLEGAKNLGIVLVNIHPTILMEAQNYMHLVLGIFWQVFRIQLARRVLREIHDVNEKLKFLGYRIFDEDDVDLKVMGVKPGTTEKKAEAFLLKWMNSLIVPAGFDAIANFGNDVKNGKVSSRVVFCFSIECFSLISLSLLLCIQYGKMKLVRKRNI
jgi:hypothetical protein